MIGHLEREEIWKKKTGLKRSNAQISRVFQGIKTWMYFTNSDGFDHTMVFQKNRQYVLLTEPYHSVGHALHSLLLATEREGSDFHFQFAIGEPGTGIWNPGYCFPLLVAKKDVQLDLKLLAAALPKGYAV